MAWSAEVALAHAAAADAQGPGRVTRPSPTRIAVLAVASGPGIVQTFRNGSERYHRGGQSMNPSTEDLLKAIEKVPQNEVILLPNNGNIIMSARQTQSLTKKHGRGAHRDHPPGHGRAHLHELRRRPEENARGMEQAARQVETAEITRAIRDAKVNGIDVKEGDVIGLLNNALVARGDDRDTVAWDMLERDEGGRGRAHHHLLGRRPQRGRSPVLPRQRRERYKDAEVELINGGQPFYDYIISVE